MADLVFATRGQAEALAAQEALRKKALETKQEFEAGAKAAGAWDSSLGKLKSAGERALRSIQTEQEKIIDKINAIKESQEKGLVPPEEAEESLRRLRQEWIDVDEATLRAAEATEREKAAIAAVAAEQGRLKSAAESTLRSIRTESEQIEKQIQDIEAAMEQGLIPPDEAEEGITRLKEKMKDLGDEAGSASDKVLAQLRKAFDPMQIIKVGLSFVGVKAAISAIKAEIADVQEAIDRRYAEFLKPRDKMKELQEAEADAKKDFEDSAASVEAAKAKLRQASDEEFARDEQRETERKKRLADVDRDLKRRREDEKEAKAKRFEAWQKAQAAVDDRKAAGEEPTFEEQQRLDRAQAELNQTPTSTRRAIEDLERRRQEIIDEGKQPGDTSRSDAARAEVEAARAAEAEALARAQEAASARQQYEQSPEYRRGRVIENREQALDDAYAELAAMADTAQLSTEELKKLADVLRETGNGALARSVRDMVDRIDDGSITVDEANAQLQDEIKRLQSGLTMAPIYGGHGGMQTPNVGPTQQELQQAAILEKLIDALQENTRVTEENTGGGLVGGGE